MMSPNTKQPLGAAAVAEEQLVKRRVRPGQQGSMVPVEKTWVRPGRKGSMVPMVRRLGEAWLEEQYGPHTTGADAVGASNRGHPRSVYHCFE